MKNYLLWAFYALLPLRVFAQSLEDGLVLHFSADHPGVDLSGNNNHGHWIKIKRAPGIPGIADSALYFDGQGSRIEVPASPSLNSCESFSISLWCKYDLLLSANSSMYLMARPIASTVSPWQEARLECMLTDFNFVVADKKNAQASVACGEKRVGIQNEWYYLTAVYDQPNREIRLYVNGHLSNRNRVSIDAQFSGESALYFGTRYVKGQFISLFTGAMDDIRLYNRVLSEAEVTMLTRRFAFSKPQGPYEPLERLQAGRYIIETVDSSGALNTNWQMVEISAEEPFWKKSWFLGTCIAITFLLTFGILYFYNRGQQQAQTLEFEKVRTLERERFRIARDMHDDIGSGLSAINLLTEIALNKNKDPLLAAEIERIAAASRDVHTRIQDIIWAISLQNDTLASLLHYLQRFAADFLAPAGLVSHFNIPDKFPVHIISGDRRRAIFLAFKEALHNVVKHARATQVDMAFMVSSRLLIIRIRDNGCGIDPTSANSLGNGLSNMKKRMEDAGAAFDLKSDKTGTTVTFELPL